MQCFCHGDSSAGPCASRPTKARPQGHGLDQNHIQRRRAGSQGRNGMSGRFLTLYRSDKKKMWTAQASIVQALPRRRLPSDNERQRTPTAHRSRMRPAFAKLHIHFCQSEASRKHVRVRTKCYFLDATDEHLKKYSVVAERWVAFLRSQSRPKEGGRQCGIWNLDMA